MTPDEVRQIIKEELENLIKTDRYVFDRKIQILDARNIQLGRGTGTKIGTEGGATGQKIGFFSATPVTERLKADHANWAALSNVVDALVELGLFDQA